MPQITPTKGNLISTKRSMTLAQLGFELIDRKRNILIREITTLIDTAAELQSKISSVFSEAYGSLQIANITLGICEEIAGAVEVDDSINIITRSVMGVELPQVIASDSPPKLAYGFSESNGALDDAYIKFHRVKELTHMLAEVETKIYRLAHAIKRAQKRANALTNIIIPNFDATIKFISEALEEKEREEFVRLKVIKNTTN